MLGEWLPNTHVTRKNVKCSQAAGRNTTRSDSFEHNRFLSHSRSSGDGSEAPSVTTPCTTELDVFRRGDQPITIIAPKLPSIREMSRWKVRIGHALAAVSGYNDDREVGWFMELESKNVDDINTSKSEHRFGLLEAQLALSLYNTCPNSLHTRITER